MDHVYVLDKKMMIQAVLKYFELPKNTKIISLKFDSSPVEGKHMALTIFEKDTHEI